jgi:secreted PhoX family phosphatase
VWQSDLSVPAHVQDISGVTGRAAYEGVQNDDRGNIYLVEDAGGKGGTTTPDAKQPNSFVYRVVPRDRADLTRGGTLQALQVIDGDHPITFHAGANDADILGADVADLHTYGKRFATRWITLHDTATDGDTTFDANALAKARSATPFKRPENGVFQPGTDFRSFFFTETGDTNANTQAGAAHGGYGAVMRLDQNPWSDSGTLRMLFRGDVLHTGFDNITFVGGSRLAVVEDGGDLLHTQRNAYDSAYLLDTRTDYASGDQPTRFIAQGRDASATYDASCPACGNDGDNEITGIHASDGDPSVDGILGAKEPELFRDGWRLFYTRQHGDNVTYEVLPARS